MKNNFFILGLPRSRTAWLASFMNFMGAFCYHEGINGCKSIDEYKKKLWNDKGDSLTGGTLIDIENIFPDAPKVIIDSDPDNSIRFAYEVYGHYMPGHFHEMKRKLDNIKGLHIDINDINGRLHDIWNHLKGGEYDSEKAEIIKKLNIQVLDPHDIDQSAASELLNAV